MGSPRVGSNPTGRADFPSYPHPTPWMRKIAHSVGSRPLIARPDEVHITEVRGFGIDKRLYCPQFKMRVSMLIRVVRFLVDFRGRTSDVALYMPFLILMTMRFLEFQNSEIFRRRRPIKDFDFCPFFAIRGRHS